MGKFNALDLMLQKNEDGQFTTTKIDIDKLIPDEDNFYKVEHLEELKEGIELLKGIQQNVIVKKINDNEYKILAGHRRCGAIRMLIEEGKEQYRQVPCSIYEGEDEKLLSIITNSTARILTDWELAEQTKRLRTLLEENNIKGDKRKILAKELNIAPSKIARLDNINNHLIPELKEKFKQEEINISSAYEASTLPEEKQKEVLEQYQEEGKITIKQVQEKKREIKHPSTILEEKPKEEEQTTNIVKVDTDTGEVIEPKSSLDINYNLIKDCNKDDLAYFICDHCKGGNFCDLAIACEGHNSHEICLSWLNMQAQKR